ncbi:hypothetical protein CMZ84_15545 [Lysobacteraceae bacterium NML93-0399]|uniref:hypothetical protein n=1 Tax=Lysobacter sp. GX 14042 TaxID=2907155 RepID=UPI000BB42CEE|nr:hypothetical protein [Lysobacter sp. GX 14042]MCE7032217.1 hypothetical protein [Lysobacter sp. GX 14042]PBJ81600.1 hypothetical protein CMZ84_15545 [Xanthomonadaceae bacterium NML93-0399]
MRIAITIYASLFLLLYLYGLVLRVRSIRSDLEFRGPRKTYGGLALALASGLMFVACYGYIVQRPILHPWFWAVFFVVSVGSLLWSGRFISSLQAEHGKRAGLAAYLVNTALVLPIDLTVFLYAFRSAQIWQQA